MAVTGNVYPSWIERTVAGASTYTGGFVALLLKSTYTFDAADIYIQDLSPLANELTGGNYARVAVTGMSVAHSGSVTSVSFSPITFPLLTASGAAAPWSMVIARLGGDDSTSALMLQQDFGQAQPASSEDLTVTAASGGFIRYTSTP